MENNQSPRAIQQQWERAIQDATENGSQQIELAAENLNDAAGLHVKSGVQAGELWGISGQCTKGCSNICEGR